MSMVDNFEAKLNELRNFIYKNVPQGVGPRIEQIENQTSFFNLEFRRANVSCVLYIELDSFASDSFTDEAGNRWRKSTLEVKPSWPSYGTVDVDVAVEFARLLNEVNCFAMALKRTFAEPFVKMVETAEQIAERKQRAAEERCRGEVRSMMRANVKGMKVGQERRVEVQGPDLLPVGEVVHEDGPRKYTTNVTATRTFYVMRVT